MTHLVPYAVRLARYHAAKPAALKKARSTARLQRKRKAKARLKAVLKMAREALGWKPGGVRKLTPEHKAALQEGRQRYWKAKREKESVKKAG